MKKILAFVLTALMLAGVFASCNTAAPATSSDESSPASSEVSGGDGYVDEYVDTDDRSDVPTVKEHVMLEEVPSSFTLVGTTHLPPIDNQGALGTCASQAITYTQFTNAVSRFLHAQNKNVRWDPSSGKDSYIFAPKFTYNFSGAGTAWVYDIIKDHGCALYKDCKFFESSGYKYGDKKYNRQPQTVSWQVGQNELAKALKYRINDYDQIWMNTLEYSLTTSDKGKDLLYRIKDAVVQGNVVVTGGFSSDWQYTKLSAEDVKNSALAKAGETVCVWCKGLRGGHQVSVVGYDDDLECTFQGVTMKGAFLVANSWGTSWGNQGYFWVMYDSVNKVSEFDALNEMEGRQMSMDQFCFIYWDKDVVVGMPDAYVTAEVEITNREGFYVELTRTDSTDTAVSHVPALFDYGFNFKGVHGNYDYLNDGENYMTFSGVADGEAEVGYITLGYNSLAVDGKNFEDYLWGVNVYSTSATVRVNKISLYDGEGTLRCEITPSEDTRKVLPGTSHNYVFDMGEPLSKFHDVGSYKLKNQASGLYVTPHVLLLESGESVLDAVTFDVDFDLFERVHVIRLNGKQYVLDIQGKTVADGVPVKFNAENFTRNTQTWKVVPLEDGTYNVRLASDTRYAMGMVDGEIVLVSGSGIRDYGTWIFENAGNENMTATARVVEGKFTVAGRIPAACTEDSMTVTVYSASGETVKTFSVTGDGELRSFSVVLDDLASGTYVFAFTDSKGKMVTGCYVAVVK